MKETLLQFLRNLPLRRKLMLGLLVTCLSTLTFACAALFWFQATTFRQGYITDLEALGAIIARNCAPALALSDHESAEKVLNTLRIKPQIAAARIYDGTGNLVCEVGAPQKPGPMRERESKTRASFSNGEVHLTLPIYLGEARPGRLELIADYEVEYRRLLSLYAAVMTLVIGGSIIAILVISAGLQRLVSRPIVALANVAQNVSEHEDFSMRAPEGNRDEIGRLTQSFNRMLEQIQSRDVRLHESQQRYEVAVMGSSDGLWDCDLTTNAVYYSPRWKKIIGYDDDELANTPETFRSMVHPEDANEVFRKISDYLEGRSPTYQAKFRLRHKNAGYRWILSRGAALRDANGKPVRFAGSQTDITERKEAAEREQERIKRLAEQQAVLLKLSQASPQEWDQQLRLLLPDVARHLNVERVSFWRAKDRHQILNREALFILSLDAFDTAGGRIAAADLPHYASPFFQTGTPLAVKDASHSSELATYAQAHLAPHDIASFVHTPVCQNGHLAALIICEHVGSGRGWLPEETEFLRAIAQQATLSLESHERRRAEASLRQSEVRYRSVVESVKEVVFQTDTAGNWLFLNSAWHDITGHFLEDSLGRTCFDFVHPDDRQRCQELMRPVFENNQRGCFGEIRLLTRTGEVRWIELMAQVTVDRDRVLGGLSGTLTDITKRKSTEAEMDRLHRDLVHTSRHAGMAEVATGVLHNVGNVLNSVNVSANLIVDHLRKSKTSSLTKAVQLLRDNEADVAAFFTDHPKGKQLPAFLSAVSEQLIREQNLLGKEVQGLLINIEHIKQIVAMQQTYAKVSGTIEILAITDLVEDALRMSSGALARSQIEVVRQFSAVPPVSVDRHKALQILVNLISNAKQAMDSRAEDRRLILRVAAAESERVVVEVDDNGMGISAENLTRIFNHGFTTKKTGHGFGLHSGANDAKQLGGRLTVRSAGPGQGATFTLELPIRSMGGPADVARHAA